MALLRRMKKRFKSQIRLWILRRLSGRYRGFPEQLPPLRSVHDRIFADWDTLEWIVVWGTMRSGRWQPDEEFVTKPVLAAMLGVKESTLNVLMKRPEFKRVPKAQAPTVTEAWFRTSAIMLSRKIVSQMRKYKLPA